MDWRVDDMLSNESQPRIAEPQSVAAAPEQAWQGTASGQVLLVDDDEDMCELVRHGLSQRGFRVSTCSSAAQALELLEERPTDVLLTDLALHGMDGLELCRRAAETIPDIPVVVITAYGNMDTAVAALRAGARDFVTKPVDLDTLAHIAGRTIEHQALRAEVKRLRQRHVDPRRFDEMVGESDSIRKVYDMVSCIAPTHSSVLITGESGTGKELIARALHQRSNRAQGPFVALSCAAVPANLLESELFGHNKGAFTDARNAREGLFVEADGGTLFLDEVGELPTELQPKLLRVLQERKVRPLGSTRELDVDVRIVSATNRDLESDVEAGRFREDLYYRINVVHLSMPPLRSRGNDVLLLAQAFLERFAERSRKEITGLSSEAAARLLAYDWPGNVRELANTVESAVALARYDHITVEDLPEKVRNHRSSNIVVGGNDPSQLIPLRELERRYIYRALQACGGNKSDAARVLGLDRRTLYRKLERYGDRPSKA